MIRVEVAQKLGRFDLDVAFESDGGVVALFGPSGSGKSSVLNLIAGLTRPDRGRISLDDRVLVDIQAGIVVPKHRRRVGLVFQDAQLFPHLSVRQNLLLGRWFAPRADRTVAFAPVIDALGIGDLLGRRPGKLSGGEKQRVAIGRALLTSPKILLMDEPLASLDVDRRLEILPLIERLRDDFKIPIVYVSHAVDEVARLAAKVVMLERGRVAAIGAVEEVFGPSQRPSDRFARSSVISGHVARTGVAHGLSEIAHPAGGIWLAGDAGAVGRDVRIVVRATDIALATVRPSHISVRTVLSGTVAQIEPGVGPLAAVDIDLDGHGRLVASATRMAVEELALAPGVRVFALIKTVALDERALAR